MKKKLILLTICLALIVSMMAGCAKTPAKEPAKEPATTEPATEPEETEKPEETDAVSSASVVSDEESFKKGISKEGTFIVLTTKDLTFEEDLVVDGTFTKADKEGKEVPVRSLAFTQTGAERYSVTAPNMIIKSENTLMEYGIFKGDVYVQAPGFTTKDATIEGNLYFATQELMDAFEIDELTKVSGETAVKEYTK